MDDRPLSVKARKKVKAELEKKEREKHMQLFQRRMELARAGALYFKAGKYKESVQNYYLYLSTLERSKDVKSGGLTLKVFDPKKDVAELLLLTGVYWDLAKIHDRTSKKDTTKIQMYLDLLVEFSKGLPFQHVSAELIRKFLINGSPRNRALFKDAHIRLGGGKCFIATAVEEHCRGETLPALRQFRDDVLLKRRWGKVIVGFYYFAGPPLARLVLRTPEPLQKRLACFFDSMAKHLK